MGPAPKKHPGEKPSSKVKKSPGSETEHEAKERRDVGVLGEQRTAKNALLGLYTMIGQLGPLSDQKEHTRATVRQPGFSMRLMRQRMPELVAREEKKLFQQAYDIVHEEFEGETRLLEHMESIPPREEQENTSEEFYEYLLRRINEGRPEDQRILSTGDMLSYFFARGVYITKRFRPVELGNGVTGDVMVYTISQYAEKQMVTVETFSDPHFDHERQRASVVEVRRMRRRTVMSENLLGMHAQQNSEEVGAGYIMIFDDEVKATYQDRYRDIWKGIVSREDFEEGIIANEGGHASFDVEFGDQDTEFRSSIITDAKGSNTFSRGMAEELYSNWKTLQRAPLLHTLFIAVSLSFQSDEEENYGLCRLALEYAMEESGFGLEFPEGPSDVDAHQEFANLTREKGLGADPEFVQKAIAFRGAFYRVFENLMHNFIEDEARK